MGKSVTATDGKKEARPKPPPGLMKAKAFLEIASKPKGDWSIDKIATACAQIGLTCTPPSNGSHYKISSPLLGGILMVPAKRPVKPVYIKLFVALGHSHCEAVSARDGENHD